MQNRKLTLFYGANRFSILYNFNLIDERHCIGNIVFDCMPSIEKQKNGTKSHTKFEEMKHTNVVMVMP